jgi:hypothetical protein
MPSHSAIPFTAISGERRATDDRRSTRRGGRRRTDKLACPSCGSLQSAVVPHHMTVAEQRTDGYWRRRACEACGQVFATVERLVNVEVFNG